MDVSATACQDEFTADNFLWDLRFKISLFFTYLYWYSKYRCVRKLFGIPNSVGLPVCIVIAISKFIIGPWILILRKVACRRQTVPRDAKIGESGTRLTQVIRTE